jgi:hypothetical protein
MLMSRLLTEATINMAATVTNIDSEGRGPKPGYRQASDTRVKAALPRHAGNISAAAQALHMSRQALHARVQRSPELQTAARDAREQIADIADSKIVQSIKRGDMATVRWFADRQMRDRGYGRHDEVEQKPPPDPERDARSADAGVHPSPRRPTGSESPPGASADCQCEAEAGASWQTLSVSFGTVLLCGPLVLIPAARADPLLAPFVPWHSTAPVGC